MRNQGNKKVHEVTHSRKSAYTLYTVDYQQLKCLQNSLHFFQSAYIVGNQQPKPLHYR